MWAIFSTTILCEELLLGWQPLSQQALYSI